MSIPVCAPAKKLYEELITHGEGIVRTAHDKIMVLKRDDKNMNPADLDQRIREQVEAVQAVAHSFDAERLKSALKEVVPEYTPDGSDPAP